METPSLLPWHNCPRIDGRHPCAETQPLLLHPTLSENSMQLGFRPPCHSSDHLNIFFMTLGCANTLWLLLLFSDEPCVFVGSTCLMLVTDFPPFITSHSTPPYASSLFGTGGGGRSRIMLWAHLSFLKATSCILFIKFKIVPRGTNAASWMDGGGAFFTCNRN